MSKLRNLGGRWSAHESCRSLLNLGYFLLRVMRSACVCLWESDGSGCLSQLSSFSGVGLERWGETPPTITVGVLRHPGYRNCFFLVVVLQTALSGHARLSTVLVHFDRSQRLQSAQAHPNTTHLPTTVTTEASDEETVNPVALFFSFVVVIQEEWW